MTVTTTGSGVLDLRATGAVTIAGTVNVSGATGGVHTDCLDNAAGSGGGATGNPLGVGVNGANGADAVPPLLPLHVRGGYSPYGGGGGGGGSIGAAAVADLAVATTPSGRARAAAAAATRAPAAAAAAGAAAAHVSVTVSATGRLLANGGNGLTAGLRGRRRRRRFGRRGVSLRADRRRGERRERERERGHRRRGRGHLLSPPPGGAGGVGRMRISALSTSCRLNGAFSPTLVSACTVTSGAGTPGRAYVAAFPD